MALQGLYLSGLLRQSVWDHRFTDVKLAQLERKYHLLDKLYTQQQQLTHAGEIPSVNLLLLERELMDISLALIDVEQQQSDALALYRQLTGRTSVPQDIVEIAPPLIGSAQYEKALTQHPLWRLQALNQQQQILLIKGQHAVQQDPWIVSLTAKNTSDNQIDDQQLGLGITVPLNLGSALSQSELSQWQQSDTEQALNRDRIYLELKTQVEKLHQQQQHLSSQQTLLTRALSLSRTITEALAKVKDQSEISYEVWLRRYMEALDTESRLALNQVAQQQLHSQQRQALGISL